MKAEKVEKARAAAAERARARKQAEAEQRAAERQAEQKAEQKAEEEAEQEDDSGVYYKNCAAVQAAGKAPIRVGDPGYAKHLDRDGDGQGCAGD